MEDIFSTVTPEEGFSDEYYDIVNNYVSNIVNGCSVDYLPDKYFLNPTYSFNGRIYNKKIVMYDYGQYFMVSYALLNWAVHNPEKIC